MSLKGLEGSEARRRKHKTLRRSLAEFYTSTMPALLLQTPAFTVVGRYGHVLPRRVLDHRRHAPREELRELAGCGAGALGRIRVH
jgi:hypothetical protein